MLALTETGLCVSCKRWFELEQGALPVHTLQGQEEKCVQSRYSPIDRGYVVKNLEEAMRLARWIQGDDMVCLHRSGGLHSGTCGDGRDCAAVRRRLAQALATFFLGNFQTLPLSKKKRATTAA